MNRSLIGWIWVAGQALLLGVLIVAPGSDHWPTPAWLEGIAALLFFGGLAIVAMAALGLGAALTPTPVPNKRGGLTTSGLYRYARHPIYTGVLTLVAAMALRSGSWIHLFVAALTFVFFDQKAAWEEKRLSEEFPDYGAYADRTAKFFPPIY